MAFVPGFDHDVFISYAHGDDRAWIKVFYERLRPALGRLLPGAEVWIDQVALGKSQDFRQEIPISLKSSAVLISLVSPTYIGQRYCVEQECRPFVDLAAVRKQIRFSAAEFATELFSFRCPILPIEDRAYWNDLIPGATDISFCDDISTCLLYTSPSPRDS